MAVFALKGGFTDAENRGDIVANCGGNFLGDVGFGFVEDIAAFGMANNGIIYETAELRESDLACVCAIIAPVEILSGELELATINLKRK